MTDNFNDFAMKTTADIVIAFLAQTSVSAAELPALVRSVRSALTDPVVAPARPTGLSLVAPAAAPASPGCDGDLVVEPQTPPERPEPAVPIDASVFDDYIVSLEDGKHYRSLKRHLMAKYGMTPDDYRQKWGLPSDYPMVAPSYAQERSEVAKRIGLGKTPAPAPTRRKAGH